MDGPTNWKWVTDFERSNPAVAIHCLAHEFNECFTILYISPHMHLCHHKISLLLLDMPDGHTGMHHYVWVKNLSRLVTNGHEHARHVCMSCL